MSAMGPVLGLLFALQGVAAPPPPPPVAPPGEQIGFRSDKYDRMTVAVRIGGQGPFRFLVDTGADSSAVSRVLAEQLKLEP
ncbi:MAG: aspartyl protease family protein, partial [Sphingomicrobium sp.]